MTTYTHIFELGFSVGDSACTSGEHIPTSAITDAVQARVAGVFATEAWIEAFGLPAKSFADEIGVPVETLPLIPAVEKVCTCNKEGRTFNHAFVVSCVVNGASEDNSATKEQLYAAIMDRIQRLDAVHGWSAALGVPYDTYCESTYQ